MKISVEHAPLEENEVILRCSNLDQEMLWVLSILRSGLQKLCAWDERREVTLLSPSEVVYCESVDDHTFQMCIRDRSRGALSRFHVRSQSICLTKYYLIYRIWRKTVWIIRPSISRS